MIQILSLKKIPKLLPPNETIGTTGTGSQAVCLLTIGESTIAGVGVDTHRHGITGYLAAFLSEKLNRKIEWEVFAQSVLTSKGILEKLKNEPIQTVPDIILIGTGANDGFRLNSPIVFRNNISQVIELLQVKFPQTPIVFANMPPISSFPAFPKIVRIFVGKTVSRYGKELVKLTTKYPHMYFDEAKIKSLNWRKKGSSADDFFSDGVHPSKLAYQLWGERIGEFMLKNGLFFLANK